LLSTFRRIKNTYHYFHNALPLTFTHARLCILRKLGPRLKRAQRP
jgi:hypothetical protein